MLCAGQSGAVVDNPAAAESIRRQMYCIARCAGETLRRLVSKQKMHRNFEPNGPEATMRTAHAHLVQYCRLTRLWRALMQLAGNGALHVKCFEYKWTAGFLIIRFGRARHRVQVRV